MPRDRGTGLVARVTELLHQLPGLDRTGDVPGALGQTTNLPPAQRRALLALRIALLRTAAIPAPNLQTQLTEPEDHLPPPVPEPAPPPPPPPSRKPPRVSVTTMSLEDAALLLGAAATDADPTPDISKEAPPPASPAAMKNAFAALAMFDTAEAPAGPPDVAPTSSGPAAMEDTFAALALFDTPEPLAEPPSAPSADAANPAPLAVDEDHGRPRS